MDQQLKHINKIKVELWIHTLGDLYWDRQSAAQWEIETGEDLALPAEQANICCEEIIHLNNER